jgi:hypothetical protein
MAGKSLLFYEDEFTKLVEGRFRKLDKLELPEKTKAGLLRRAKKMLPKGTAEPLSRFVMCKMIGDTLVGKVVGSQAPKAKAGKKPGKPARKPAAGEAAAKKTAAKTAARAAKKAAKPKADKPKAETTEPAVKETSGE